MLKIIDNFLNKTTMYRVVLYYLLALWVIALIFSFFGFFTLHADIDGNFSGYSTLCFLCD